MAACAEDGAGGSAVGPAQSEAQAETEENDKSWECDGDDGGDHDPRKQGCCERFTLNEFPRLSRPARVGAPSPPFPKSRRGDTENLNGLSQTVLEKTNKTKRYKND